MTLKREKQHKHDFQPAEFYTLQSQYIGVVLFYCSDDNCDAVAWDWGESIDKE